jgi:medium-chain acyl-[acyl-carrier-protein] hydrolase
VVSPRYAGEATVRGNGAWVTRPLPRPDARLRLFCLPYAGGGASLFRAWAKQFAADVEVCPVQLPGRESRLFETRYRRIGPLVQALVFELGNEFVRPFALFGHSLGALVAYELARWSQSTGASGLAALYVSGHRAPHLPNRHPMIHTLPDDQFVRELRRLDGTPAEVLEDEELRELMLPLLRADFALAETYEHEPGELLDCPVKAFGGRGDWVVAEDEIVAWRACTRGPFSHRMLPGGHFLVDSASGLLVEQLEQDVRGLLRRHEAAG